MSDIPRCYCDSCGNRFEHLGKPDRCPKCGSIYVAQCLPAKATIALMLSPFLLMLVVSLWWRLL